MPPGRWPVATENGGTGHAINWFINLSFGDGFSMFIAIFRVFLEMVSDWVYHISGKRKGSSLVKPQRNSTRTMNSCDLRCLRARESSKASARCCKRLLYKPSSRIFHLQTTIVGYIWNLSSEKAQLLLFCQVLKRIPGSGKKPCSSFLRVVVPAVPACIPGEPAVASLGEEIDVEWF